MRPSALFVPLVAIFLAAPARASDVQRAAAQALFDQARELMAASRFTEACPKLAESQRLEPISGTLLNLAVCREREGKTATAWLLYTEAIALAAREGNAERQRLARARLAEIEPKLSRLQLILPDRVPMDYWVAIDDVRLARAAWTTDIPIDPGIHRVLSGAPGMTVAERSVEITRAGTLIELRLPDLEPTPAPPSARRVRSARQSGHSSELRWAAMGASFGLGAAGLAFGTYAGLRAGAAWDDRNERCRRGCDQRAVDAGQTANHLAIASNVAFGVGIVGLGVGSYLLLSWPAPQKRHELRAKALITDRVAALVVQGAF